MHSAPGKQKLHHTTEANNEECPSLLGRNFNWFRETEIKNENCLKQKAQLSESSGTYLDDPIR